MDTKEFCERLGKIVQEEIDYLKFAVVIVENDEYKKTSIASISWKPTSTVAYFSEESCEIEGGIIIQYERFEKKSLRGLINRVRRRFYARFLESLGLDITKESLLVLTILHELGHLYHKNQYSTQGLVRKYDAVMAITNNLTLASFNKKERKRLEKSGVDVYNNLRAHEAIADSFAYANFMFIWNRLKKENLI